MLGICYGQQLMAHLLGGEVRKGDKGEYGLATLDLAAPPTRFSGPGGRQQIWMSHRDAVAAPPAGFTVAGRTDTCAVAAMADARPKTLRTSSFIPKWCTPRAAWSISPISCFACAAARRIGTRAIACRCIEQEIRECAGGRNVFFFVSGGVDSSVAFALCHARPGGGPRARRLCGYRPDARRRNRIRRARLPGVAVEHAAEQFLGALAGVTDPEQKRHIIGEEFVRVQERIMESRRLLDERLDSGPGHHLSRHHRIRAARPRPRSSRRIITAWRESRS